MDTKEHQPSFADKDAEISGVPSGGLRSPPHKDVSMWSIDDVVHWAENNELTREYTALHTILREEEYNGNALLRLTLGELKDPSGVFNFKHGTASNVMQAISELNMGIDQILHKLSNSQCCVLDTIEGVNVATTLWFSGRQQQQVELGKIEEHNIRSFSEGSKVKQSYQCPLVHGSLGVGKSRLVAEFNRSLKLRYGTKFQCGFITLDCSAGDSGATVVPTTSADNTLAVSVLAHFFFGRSASWLRDSLAGSSSSTILNSLTFGSVMKYISIEYNTATTPMLLAIQLDEFAKLGTDLLNGFLACFTTHLIEAHPLQICLLPTLSGTTTQLGIKAVSASELVVKPMLVPPLTEKETEEVIQKAWEDNPKDEPVSELLPSIIAALGNIPRNISIFLSIVEQGVRPSNTRQWLSATFVKVTEGIQQMYSPETWGRFVGDSKVGVTRMCVWVLAGKEVRLNDKLNGVSVEDIRSTGIVQVQEVRDADDLYTMHIPLATLAALNINFKFVPPQTLNPVEMVSWMQFEHTMASLYVLRNNMLVSLNQKWATYRELFPHAIGRTETLDRKVSIKKLEIYQTLGSSATHESFHINPMNEIPVGQDSASRFIDATQGESYMRNVEKAPSMDGMVVHFPLRDLTMGGSLYQIQADQFKSSAHITNGQPPTSQLKIGNVTSKKTIMGEYAKVNNTAHKNFYTTGTQGRYQLTFAVISNRPLEGWSKLCKSPEDLPENVLIICNQNFKQYGSVFCHRGIFIQYDSNLPEEDQGEENMEEENTEVWADNTGVEEENMEENTEVEDDNTEVEQDNTEVEDVEAKEREEETKDQVEMED